MKLLQRIAFLAVLFSAFSLATAIKVCRNTTDCSETLVYHAAKFEAVADQENVAPRAKKQIRELARRMRAQGENNREENRE